MRLARLALVLLLATVFVLVGCATVDGGSERDQEPETDRRNAPLGEWEQDGSAGDFIGFEIEFATAERDE